MYDYSSTPSSRAVCSSCFLFINTALSQIFSPAGSAYFNVFFKTTDIIIIDQDLNQDGYGDVVVGAPGVGDDVGAAYILFGGETFAESYGLGSLDGDNGFVLTAPSSGGYAGCSVAGIGEHDCT